MKSFLNGMIKSPYELNTTMWKSAPGEGLNCSIWGSSPVTSSIIADASSKSMGGGIMALIKDMTSYDLTEAEEHMEHIERERQAVTDKALIFLSDRCNSMGGVDNCLFFNIKNRKDCPVGGFSCDEIKPDDWKHYFLGAKKPSVSNEDTTPGDMEDTTPGDMWDIL